MSNRLQTAVTICLFILSTTVRADGPASPKQIDLGSFTLPDFHGTQQRLADIAASKPMVIAFLGTECPLAKLYAPRLAQLAAVYGQRGVVFVGVDANFHDTPTKIAAFTQQSPLGFPLLLDSAGKLADALGATRTPEIFVLDSSGSVRYRGRVDDQYGVGVQRDKPTCRDLAVSLDALLAGKPVAQPVTTAVGCLISRAPNIEPHGDVTYTKNVAAILNRRCVECHRAGELAPFALTSYQEALPWAAMIREVVGENRMPPWLASPEFGKFSNDCSLSRNEKETLFTWIDNGCPEGDRALLPAPPKFTTGWRMGEPDRVYYMPEAYAVPAEGTVDYQYFIVENDLKEDLWVSTAEARPGNVAVVHHVVLFAVPPDRKVSKDNLEDAQVNGQMISIYAPGMNPWRYPAGAAMKIAAGSQLVIQAHYTPNGTAQQDRSYVGLKILKPEEVRQQVRYNLVANTNFEIPAGADNHEVRQAVRILKDLRLLNLFPHMHYRGKSFRFEVEYPDGRREVLLDVPRYDFTWQLRYDLAEPKLLPKGSRLICIAHYDNSDANPLNPDATKAVHFGLQSWEEMLVGYYTSVPAEQPLAAAGP